ncbi:MAG: 3'-5' exonuclease [Planctomycetes bacterium]|nr:3'-5' exonuclease [Planctomycetota bacterium]
MPTAVEGSTAFLAEHRRAAARWAQGVVADPDAVILDTETTGLDARAQVVDIAVIDTAGRVLVDRLVRPSGRIPAAARAVHGITDRMVAAAPRWPELHRSVGDVLRRASRVIIYNASYDVRLLRQTRLRYRLPTVGPPRRRYECAMRWNARYVGEWNERHESFRWPRLEGGDHRALGDCRATLRVIAGMAGGRLARAL